MGFMDRLRKQTDNGVRLLVEEEAEQQEVDQLIEGLRAENQKPREQPMQFRKPQPAVKEYTKMIDTKEDNGLMARLHHLKLQENFAGSVANGEKPFELRRNDRGYQKGDLITFEVVNSIGALVPGHEIESKTYLITYVISGWGLQEGFVCLGIKEVKKDEVV